MSNNTDLYAVLFPNSTNATGPLASFKHSHKLLQSICPAPPAGDACLADETGSFIVRTLSLGKDLPVRMITTIASAN